MNSSHIPFARGHNGVILKCLNPCSSANCANINELNGGPLSYLIHDGMPNVANNSFSTGITTDQDLLDIILTIGYREYSQTATKRYFAQRKVP